MKRCQSLPCGVRDVMRCLLCWCASLCWRRRLRRCRGAAADRARGRPDRHARPASDIAALTQKLQDFEARKGSQIAVLIVPTTAPETIEQYSIRVAEAWKIGRKKIDDGAILRDRQERPQAAHRGRLWPRRRADRRHGAGASSTRSSRRNFKSGDFCRRHCGGVDADDRRDRRRAVAGAGRSLGMGRNDNDLAPIFLNPLNPFIALRRVRGRRDYCGACSAACSARSSPAAWSGWFAWYSHRIDRRCAGGIARVRSYVLRRRLHAANQQYRVTAAAAAAGRAAVGWSGGGGWSSGSSSSGSSDSGFSGGGGSFGGGGASGSW